MKAAGSPVVKDLVLVGGGHSHVAVLKRFGMRPLPGTRLTVICRDSHTPYSGMLPGHVAGHYEFDEAHIDLGPLSRFANARFYRSSAVRLDLADRRVVCDDRPPVSFDLLSINSGSTPSIAAVRGGRETVMSVKPISAFLGRWKALERRVLRSEGLFRLSVVGGGAGGVEMLLSVQNRLNGLASSRGRQARVEYHLFHAGDRILLSHNEGVRRRFEKLLSNRGVICHLGEPVVEVAPGKLRTLDGQLHNTDQILWATEAAAPAWPGESGLDVDENGFIAVNDRLQSTSHPEVFAAGDIASIVGHALPKSGVFAVRQGKCLERNLRRSLLGEELRSYRPQTHSLSLISTGDRFAVASRGRWSAAGSGFWWLKDRIDRRFVEKYNRLPEIADTGSEPGAKPAEDTESSAGIDDNAMRCGGCGSKIGASTLDRVLGSLAPSVRKDVLIGLGDSDDAAVVEQAPGILTVHTVDSFRALLDDPYLFGKIAANHCLGDIYAMGGLPRTALAVATIPFGPEAKVADDLSQMMKGATEMLDAEDCALIGGHTGEGAELGLGFAVNGTVDEARLVRKSGLRPGDRLVVTRPIGTGTLFAADMRGRAKRRWIDSALVYMTRSNRAVSACLLEHSVSAMTDVTGFGLLGHLHEMVQASGVTVDIDVGAVPIMPGAEETAGLGLLSSLQPQNLRLEGLVSCPEGVGNSPRYRLLFDPQTAGGMLAGIPEARVESCIDSLRSLGETEASVLGTVMDAAVSADAPAARIRLN